MSSETLKGWGVVPCDKRHDPRIGALVTLCGLNTDTHLKSLSGQYGTVAGPVSSDEDSCLMIHLKEVEQKAVLVPRANLCFLDQFIAHRASQGRTSQAIYRVIREDWQNPYDWQASANVFFEEVTQVIMQQQSANQLPNQMNVSISVYFGGILQDFQPQRFIGVRRPLQEEQLWNGCELLAGIRLALLHRSLYHDVVEANIDWDAQSQEEFQDSVKKVIMRAHKNPHNTVQVALRTHSNTSRFCELELLVTDTSDAPGCCILVPNEALAFQFDNYMKLSTSTMTVAKASRKVAQTVSDSYGNIVTCMICKKPFGMKESANMPCECMASVHPGCLINLCDRGKACPLCNEPIEPNAL
tara:strand:- start:79 stop:1146 length:1068 start_codon:yes stop_codon:yes gene_type:complete